MLSDLRRHISKEIKLGEGGQIFKFLCERCLDKQFSDMLVADLLKAASDTNFNDEESIYFLDCLGFNVHFEDYLEHGYNDHPILTLILKCIVNEPIIETLWENPIEFMMEMYGGENNTPAIKYALHWLETETINGCTEIVKIMSDQSLSKEEFSEKAEELVFEYEESLLYYIVIEYPESDDGKHYCEFVDAMEILGLEQITDTIFACFYLDFDSGEGDRCLDLNKIELGNMLDLIKDISKDPLHNYSGHNAVFSCFGDQKNHYPLINQIMNIKHSEKEVLF